LEDFHSLYDIDKGAFDYFANADTAAIRLLRNALHHRDHELFSSWNAMMAQEGGPARQFLEDKRRTLLNGQNGAGSGLSAIDIAE
jgi:hypothetical protein